MRFTYAYTRGKGKTDVGGKIERRLPIECVGSTAMVCDPLSPRDFLSVLQDCRRCLQAHMAAPVSQVEATNGKAPVSGGRFTRFVLLGTLPFCFATRFVFNIL